MRAARPAAGADDTELLAHEEEQRINAVPESIPAVRGMAPPPRRPCRDRVPDPASSRVGPGSSLGSIPCGSRASAGEPAPGGFPSLLSLGDPLPPKTRISCLSRVPLAICGPRIPRPRTTSLPFSRGIPLLTRLHPIQAALLLDLRTRTPAAGAAPESSDPSFALHPLPGAWRAPGAGGTGAHSLLRPAARVVVKRGCWPF